VIGITEKDSYLILLPATIGALVSALALGQLGPHYPAAGAPGVVRDAVHLARAHGP